jgi:hypothetical protein
VRSVAQSGDISFQKAIETTEHALSEVDRLAMEQIRSGAEISSHVETAERALRDTLRQLVLAERQASRRVASDTEPADLSTARLAKES